MLSAGDLDERTSTCNHGQQRERASAVINNGADVLKRFTTDRAFWAFVEVTRDVLAAAETLVTTHSLRTRDAIHLASAHLFKTRLAAPELRFVSADQRQTDAAAAAGMTATYIGS